MKKILFVDSGFSSGGAEHQSAQLINMLVDRGYEVTCATFRDIPDHYYISPNVNRIKFAPGASTWKKLLAMEIYLLKTDADVVFAFSQRLSCIVLFPMLLRPKIKVISSERNYTIASPDKWEKILINTGIYNRANYIVSNNYSQGRYIVQKFPAIKNKVSVITNFTDVDSFAATPVPNNKVIRIGIFCRFEQQKNFHRLLDALCRLNELKRYSYHIDWYGNHTFNTVSQQQYFDIGMSKIKQYKLERYVTIHAPIKNVEKMLPSFDVLCLPSLHEGFSNSISEYICCGRPVLCSDVSDNSLMVHDGENGFLFDPFDVDNIINAFIRYFETTNEQRVAMGVKSRQIAERLFNKDNFIESYIKLIEE